VDYWPLQQVCEAFKNFIENYSVSELSPDALFSIGMTYGGPGWMQQGVQSFQTFISKNPNYPLVADARMVIQELK